VYQDIANLDNATIVVEHFHEFEAEVYYSAIGDLFTNVETFPSVDDSHALSRDGHVAADQVELRGWDQLDDLLINLEGQHRRPDEEMTRSSDIAT